ncbi:hypothetical protein IAT38_007592 [Cryptococcus sp. DSM 104549]
MPTEKPTSAPLRRSTRVSEQPKSVPPSTKEKEKAAPKSNKRATDAAEGEEAAPKKTKTDSKAKPGSKPASKPTKAPASKTKGKANGKAAGKKDDLKAVEEGAEAPEVPTVVVDAAEDAPAEPEPAAAAAPKSKSAPKSKATSKAKAPKSTAAAEEAAAEAPAAADADTDGVKVLAKGDVLPSIVLKDETGKEVDVATLAGEKGVVLFLYPKADTPGCTNQACGYRDTYSEISALGYDVYGLSKDKPEAQNKWKTKKSLTYSLLSDPESQLIKRLGAFVLPKNTKRSHFIFEKGSGKLVDIAIGVKPANDPTDVLTFLQEHSKA